MAMDAIRALRPVVRVWPYEARPDRLFAVMDSRGCHACPLAGKAGLDVLKVQGDPRSGLRLLVWSPTTQALRSYLDALRSDGCLAELIGRCGPAAANGTTARQEHALRVAVESGYFDEPRRSSLGQLATGLGISKAAAGRLLRRALGGVLHPP